MSVDAHGDAEQASMNHRQREVRCLPEFVGEVVGDGGVAESNLCSLGALYAWGLGEKRQRAEGV